MRNRHYDFESMYGKRYGDDGYGRIAHQEPPPPTRPDPDQIVQNHSSTYYGKEVRSGFTVGDLDQAEAVIRAYDGGAAGSAASHTASQMSGLGGALFALHNVSAHDSSFLKILMSKLRTWHSGEPDRKYHSQSWDYDGKGPWHKATLRVERLDGGKLHVHLSRAYTSDCETPLAKVLGVLPDYRYSRQSVTWETKSDRFVIPSDFFRRVASALGIEGSGLMGDFADHTVAEMSHADPRHEQTAFSVNGQGVSATVSLGALRHYPAYRLPKIREKYPDTDLTYFASSRGLEGPSVRHHTFGNWFHAIGVDVYFYPVDGDETRCAAAGAELASHYSSLPRTYSDC